jgi:hypothetical protein
MKDDVRTAGDQLFPRSRCGKVRRHDRNLAGETGRRRGRDDIDEGEPGDLPAVEIWGGGKAICELAADHSGGTNNEDMHGFDLSGLKRGGRAMLELG